jgi:hypothetical protein
VYTLTGLAEKKGFVVFLCAASGNEGISDSTGRKKIDNTITKLHYEHLVIYIDGKKSRQHWELMIREQNKPVVCRPIDYYAGQEPELLFQKLEGLFFTFDDEEKLSIVDVCSRVMENFERNAEVVTKKFYERFEKEHGKFLGFIKGIHSKVDQEWYASLMLNRLMFIYFIQKKGFLDRDKDYLRNRLNAVQKKKGKNKFYSFYRNFLLVLFHKGLGSPLRDAELEAEIGKVPYLNGGLFDVHKLEHENKDISIEDKAFERIFDFFDDFKWHLDTRVTATGKDINPDVIGYIFEKYINDRAAMGAYYTKEDITEYISKNCIVPWLFDEVKRNYAKPFVHAVSASEDLKGRAKQSDSTWGGQIASVSRQVGIPRNDKSENIWSFLQQSGDEYIYPAVKHGIKPEPLIDNDFSDLPDDIQAGLDPNIENLVEKRKCWNRLAPPDIALPTEIYREVIARRKRYYEVRRKICAEGASASGGDAGEITEINDFITYNLDIRQFAQDVLQKTDDPDLIRHFYRAVRKITVLDPTCGSGAFLFAALNVLEPLYFACVARMREFVEEHGKGKHRFFEDELKLIDSDDHPNEEYFIYKSIILNNLYGVDIMKEAVEIAKLRLFLKLVATVDIDYSKPNLGLEPLPDIDFNIRSGNTLVGYATLADLDKGEQGGLFGDEEKQAILEEADVVSRAYARFKDAQLVMHSDPKTYKDAKDDLNDRLTVLNGKLNKHLAVMYLDPSHSKKAYDMWLSSHQPFHWLAEFYWIMQEGGFDVLIGNPPYIEYSEIRKAYSLAGYQTFDSGNAYAFVIERCLVISQSGSRLGMIIQQSGFCTPRMKSFQDFWLGKSTFKSIAFFDDRPGKLFDGLQHIRVAVCLSQKGDPTDKVATTNYVKFYTEYRPHVFRSISYVSNNNSRKGTSILKVNSLLEHSIIEKIWSSKTNLGALLTETPNRSFVYYGYGYGYFGKILNFKSYFKGERVTESTGDKYIYVQSEFDNDVIVALMNSNMFYWFYVNFSDGHNFTKHVIGSLPFVYPNRSIADKLKKANHDLMDDLRKNAQRKDAYYKATGEVQYEEFYPKLSKLIIDEIDKVLAKHYGFTPEELDFIINYDIKYRMGKELGEEE